MSSWIERELARERQASEHQRRHEEAVRNFWPQIRDRFRSDVEYFNSHCPPERVVELAQPDELSIGIETPDDGERSVTLWLEPQHGRVLVRHGAAGESEKVDLRLEINGAIEYENLLGDDAAMKLSQNLLRPILFSAR